MGREIVLLFLLILLLISSSAFGATPPKLEVKAWLYDTQDTYDRADDDTLSPAASDSAGFYWENNIDATGGSSSPARLNSNDPIWDVYSDGSTLYRLVFQFQADSNDLKYSCWVENDGYWLVDNEDGYWSYVDTAGTKQLLSREGVRNDDIADTSGWGDTGDDYRIAQSFVAKGEASSVQIYARRRYATASPAILRIETDSSNEPSGTLVSSDAVDTLPYSSFSTSSSWVTFVFDTPIPLQGDATYHIVVRDTSTMDNIPVCRSAYTQYQPKMVGDGYNGVVVTWSDYRGGSSYDIYAERYDSSGSAEWTEGGVAVCVQSSNQVYPEIASDDYHGAIIVWRDSRGADYDIYAQRMDSLGESVWAANGVPVCTTANDQEYPVIVEDGYHGAIIVWQDMRADGATYDLYAQRVDSGGNMVWTTNGVAICTAANDQWDPRLISDGYHGAIIVWYDERGADSDIYAQRADSLGNRLWGTNGAPVCTASGDQHEAVLVSDGHHGALIAWHDYRGSTGEVYIQRADLLGNMVWTADGVQVTDTSGSQSDTRICSDGYNGAILAWEDERGSDTDVYVQRVDSSGQMMWTANGVAVCTAAGEQRYPTMASDGYHGAIVAWGDRRSDTDHNIYARRVDSLGSVLWTDNGIAVTAAPDSQYLAEILSDGNHGAWITWCRDYRNADYDIYVDAVDSDGKVRFCGGGDYVWAYEAADYSEGEMLECESGSASWVHHDTLDLFFRFPACLITDYRSGWWSDPKDISHQYAPDAANDITEIDADSRLECVDATRNWLGDAYGGVSTLYSGTDSTLMWEVDFQVDEDWTDNDTTNLRLYVYKGGGGHTTDIVFKLHTTNVKLKWAYPAPDASAITNGIISSPVIRNGRVYVGAGDSKLYCLNASDGSLIWSYAANAAVNSSPSAKSESGEWVIYFACDSGYVYAVKDTGGSYEEKWTQFLTQGQAIRGSPMVMDSLLYIGCWDDSLHCLRTSDGTQRWAASVFGTLGSASASVYNNVVYIGSGSDTLYAFNATDGDVLRRKELCGDIWAPCFLSFGTGRLCIGSCASSSPTPGPDTMYVLESGNFDFYWKYADEGSLASTYASCFSLDDVNLYFGNDNNYLYCIDLSDSSLVYKYDTGDDVKSSPLYWNSVVYMGSHNDKFYALDDATQQPVTSWPFHSNGNVESSPAISLSSNIVVVGSSDGHVYAFELE